LPSAKYTPTAGPLMRPYYERITVYDKGNNKIAINNWHLNA